MEAFWAQDRLTLSLELCGILLLVLSILALIRAVTEKHKAGTQLGATLGTAGSMRIFKILRWLLAAAGVITLVITAFPGLTPFKGDINQNVGLGGLVFFLLWPLVILQLGLACISWERLLPKEPLVVWVLMLSAGIVFLAVDRMALQLAFG